MPETELDQLLDLIAWEETRSVPHCDLCHQVCHRSKLTTIPPQHLEQAPLALCPACYSKEPNR